MKKPAQRNKLALAAQTIRLLSEPALEAKVVGGTSDVCQTCGDCASGCCKTTLRNVERY